jgi:hypothetical protein
MRLPFIVLAIVGGGIAALGLVHAQGVAPRATLPATSIQAPAATASSTPAPPGGIIQGLLHGKHFDAGVPCAACHTETPPSTAADASTCLNCHGPLSALVAKTAGDRPNPHAQTHVGPIPCTACHHIHVASESYCNKCHTFDMTVP